MQLLRGRKRRKLWLRDHRTSKLPIRIHNSTQYSYLQRWLRLWTMLRRYTSVHLLSLPPHKNILITFHAPTTHKQQQSNVSMIGMVEHPIVVMVEPLLLSRCRPPFLAGHQQNKTNTGNRPMPSRNKYRMVWRRSFSF